MRTVQITICFVAILLLHQTAAKAQSDFATYRIDARLVEVYATVLDERGHFVDGLPP